LARNAKDAHSNADIKCQPFPLLQQAIIACGKVIKSQTGRPGLEIPGTAPATPLWATSGDPSAGVAFGCEQMYLSQAKPPKVIPETSAIVNFGIITS